MSSEGEATGKVWVHYSMFDSNRSEARSAYISWVGESPLEEHYEGLWVRGEGWEILLRLMEMP